jgi:hypothetical protein
MDQEEVVRNLRSCLISSKGGIRLDNLQGECKIISNSIINEQSQTREKDYRFLDVVNSILSVRNIFSH